MATTTNYSWTTPDDTALVKDGASAIRTLGSSVDTTVKNLNPETTLGDIAYRSSTANVNTRLGLGTAGQVLTVNSGATAPEWSTISTGAYTLLSTTTLSGTSTTISSINQTYKHLLVVINAATGASNMFVRIQANGSTTLSGAGGWDSWSGSSFSSGNGRTAVTTTTVCSGFLLLHNYANTSYMKSGITCFNGDLTGQFATGGYFYRSTSAVTSITIDNSITQSFTSGQVLIYGVN